MSKKDNMKWDAKKKKHVPLSQDEKITIDSFVEDMKHAATWVGVDDEGFGADNLDFEATLILLKRLYNEIKTEKLEAIKELLDMALDADYRCPK